MTDDDEVVQVWYLCGYTHYLAKQLEESIEVFQHGIELYHKTHSDDEELLASMQALLEEVQTEYANAGGAVTGAAAAAAATQATEPAKRKSSRKAAASTDDDQMDM